MVALVFANSGHTLIWSDCAIGYMILTFKVIKGHFRSNKLLWQVLLGFLPRGFLPRDFFLWVPVNLKETFLFGR